MRVDRDAAPASEIVLGQDDGIVFRLPESDAPPDDDWFFPDPSRVESLVTRHLADTPLFYYGTWWMRRWRPAPL